MITWSAIRASPYVAKYGLKVGKVLLIGILAVGWTGGAVHYGRNAERTEIALEVAAERSKELAELARVALERQPIIEKAVDDRAKLKARIDKGREMLNEATQAAGVKPECDLTDDELFALRQIGKAD